MASLIGTAQYYGNQALQFLNQLPVKETIQSVPGAVVGAARQFANNPVHFLNQPHVKENVKNIAGVVTFVFGMVALRDLYQICFQNKDISSRYNSEEQYKRDAATNSYAKHEIQQPRKGLRHLDKANVLLGKASLVLSAAVSRPGVFIISQVVGRIFSSAQLARVFGPNSHFAANPWHPRHVVSIVAVACAMPLIMQTGLMGAEWMRTWMLGYYTSGNHLKLPPSDGQIRTFAIFNTLTSRPVLHVGNRIAHIFLRGLRA